MGVYIKGMKMPKDCLECEIRVYDANAGEEYCPFSQMECLSIGLQRNCPLVEVPEPHPTGEWLRMSDLSEKDDDRYKCSHCGNVVHYKSRMDLYTFNSWCGRCGSDNSRHTTIIEWEEDAPTVIEVEGE